MAEKIPLNNFQTIADANGIEIVNFRLPNVGSMSTEVNGRCVIGLDTSRQMTRAEEQAHIGHELGHCLYEGSTLVLLPTIWLSATRSAPTAGISGTPSREKPCSACCEMGVIYGRLPNCWTRQRSMFGRRTAITKRTARQSGGACMKLGGQEVPAKLSLAIRLQWTLIVGGPPPEPDVLQILEACDNNRMKILEKEVSLCQGFDTPMAYCILSDAYVFIL